MKIGIVEPELQKRETLAQLIRQQLGWTVVWEVSNGLAAIRRCLKQKPDLILMALTLPGNDDGVKITQQIMQDNPCAIVIITDAEHNQSVSFKGIAAGALDVVAMPSSKAGSLAQFVSKMKAMRTLVQDNASSNKGTLSPSDGVASGQPEKLLIAIGCSTGGPGAVARVLSKLPADAQAAVVIVQHVDEEHALGMAEWLDSQIPMTVQAIQGGEQPEVGKVLLAKTNDHLVMDPMGRMAYTKNPVENPYRPSVDEFFCSAGQYWRSNMLAVLLTGMGRDGGRGLLALRRLGYSTFAQNEVSCAVYGMPKDAIQRGGANEILSPQDIGRRLREEVSLSSRGMSTQRGKHL